MVESGLLACDPTFQDPSCIIKLIQCTISLFMLVLVFYNTFHRLCIECSFTFYLFASIFMAMVLIFLMAYSMDSDVPMLSYMAAYCYDVYFSIIVLKVGLKLIQILRNKIKYQSYRKAMIISFIVYQVLLLAALIYEGISIRQTCAATAFLIANIIGLTAAVSLVLLGVRHNKEQQRRVDESLAEGMQNNPLPRFRCWILTNFIGQVLILVESIIYQVKDCRFSEVYNSSMIGRFLLIEDKTVNEICFAIISILSFHLGIASTIYFFHQTNKDFSLERRSRNSTLGISRPRQIEMAYVEGEEIRSKMNSL